MTINWRGAQRFRAQILWPGASACPSDRCAGVGPEESWPIRSSFCSKCAPRRPRSSGLPVAKRPSQPACCCCLWPDSYVCCARSARSRYTVLRRGDQGDGFATVRYRRVTAKKSRARPQLVQRPGRETTATRSRAAAVERRVHGELPCPAIKTLLHSCN